MGGTVKRIGVGAVTGGLSEFAQNNPFGVPLPFKNPIRSGIQGVLGLSEPRNNPYVSGPFSLDPNQFANDRAAIQAEGQKQYDETINKVPQVVSDQLKQVLPNIAEDYNAGHLLNSTAYPQEVARQASNLTQNLVMPAMQAKQGFDTGALQRGLSLEDFVNQANVSKSIGAAFAPQQPNGKQNFGTVAQGVGALAPVAKAFK